MKINTDGEWKKTGKGGAGIVIRKDDGTWFLSKSWKIKACSPAEAELLAIRGGIDLAHDFGLKDIIVETDAQSLKSTLGDIGKNGSHEFAAILGDLGSCLRKLCCSLSHTICPGYMVTTRSTSKPLAAQGTLLWKISGTAIAMTINCISLLCVVSLLLGLGFFIVCFHSVLLRWCCGPEIVFLACFIF